MENEGIKSRYQRIDRPDFASKIPPHLFAKLDEKERWLLEKVSQLDAKADWLVQKTLESNEIARDIDVRISKIEDWKAMISGRGAVVCSLVVIAVTAFTSQGARLLLDYITKRP